LTDKILTHYKQKIAALELEPSSGGCFELTIDGELVYSKLSTGSFPDEEKMVKEVGKRLK
jgi:selenoprotein W-related protein